MTNTKALLANASKFGLTVEVTDRVRIEHSGSHAAGTLIKLAASMGWDVRHDGPSSWVATEGGDLRAMILSHHTVPNYAYLYTSK